MAATSDEAVEETVHYANGTVKYTGFLLEGRMHGAWTWYRTDGSTVGAAPTMDFAGQCAYTCRHTFSTRGDGVMGDKGPGSKSKGKKQKGSAKPGSKKK